MKSNNHYETVANTILKDIYPYLILDLKNFCPFSLNSKKILEIGTGPGYVIDALGKEGFSAIYGIDKSLDMLKRAAIKNKELKNLSLLCAYAERLPFKDKSLDIVISRGSMFFWEDIGAAFKEIYRILGDDGFAILGGGYGISTPESVIEEINAYYKTKLKKTSKPKIDIDFALKTLNEIGGSAKVVSKANHGFWLLWKK